MRLHALSTSSLGCYLFKQFNRFIVLSCFVLFFFFFLFKKKKCFNIALLIGFLHVATQNDGKKLLPPRHKSRFIFGGDGAFTLQFPKFRQNVIQINQRLYKFSINRRRPTVQVCLCVGPVVAFCPACVFAYRCVDALHINRWQLLQNVPIRAVSS